MPKGIVTINLDRPRHIKFDFNSLADTEKVAGVGLGAIFAEDRIGFNMTRILLWGGLKWEDRRLTVERVGEMLQDYFQGGGSWEEITAKVLEAINACGIFGTQEDPESKNPPEEAAN